MASDDVVPRSTLCVKDRKLDRQLITALNLSSNSSLLPLSTCILRLLNNMIVGSVYLGKKARKAYKKRQAEKAAKQLVGGIVVAAPSDELVVKAPPESPTETIASPTSRRSSTATPTIDSSISYLTGVKLASASTMTYASGGLSFVPSKYMDEYAQYEQRGLSDIEPERPARYDIALYSLKAKGMQSLGNMVNAIAGYPRVDDAQGPSSDSCPTCLALLQQRHLHQHHHAQHSTQTTWSGDAYNPGRQPTDSHVDRSRHAPVVAELPTKSLSQQMAELSDTSPLVELPAELPAQMLRRGDEQPRKKSAHENRRDGVDGLPVELSADLDCDQMRCGIISKAELEGDMPQASQDRRSEGQSQTSLTG